MTVLDILATADRSRQRSRSSAEGILGAIPVLVSCQCTAPAWMNGWVTVTRCAGCTPKQVAKLASSGPPLGNPSQTPEVRCDTTASVAGRPKWRTGRRLHQSGRDAER